MESFERKNKVYAMMAVPSKRQTTHFVKQGGFTLIELLVVIAIIGILAGMVLSVVSGIKQRALIKQATVEVEGLATAIRAYRGTFSAWPATAGSDRTWTNNNEEVVTNLINQRGQNFYEGAVSNRFVRDPFRSNLFYRIKISPTGDSVTVWSCGPNCLDEGGADKTDDIKASH